MPYPHKYTKIVLLKGCVENYLCCTLGPWVIWEILGGGGGGRWGNMVLFQYGTNTGDFSRTQAFLLFSLLPNNPQSLSLPASPFIPSPASLSLEPSPSFILVGHGAERLSWSKLGNASESSGRAAPAEHGQPPETNGQLLNQFQVQPLSGQGIRPSFALIVVDSVLLDTGTVVFADPYPFHHLAHGGHCLGGSGYTVGESDHGSQVPLHVIQ